ncbi:hypothetical protein AB1Y20_002621 [Prymnesium parvum]|uniref:Pectate lyase n=1 Tax=Prymnesium parvum TaxID=97485 RepID=A0AB34J8G3_PRYPA
MAVNVDASTHITVINCVMRDLTQKAVNVQAGRYITVRNNVIYNIGHNSLTGGHGVMRQWDSKFGDDDLNYYRLEVSGNLFYNVGQRIYSWIKTKPFITMDLDEGKSILLDETDDTVLKMRFSQNLFLYGGVTEIRLKQHPNVEVSQNSIYLSTTRKYPSPQGITCKDGGMPGLEVWGNLVHSGPGEGAKGNSFDLNTCMSASDYPTRLHSNWMAGGGANRGDLPGITDLGADGQLFSDPQLSNFTPNAASGVSSAAGVPRAELDRMLSMISEYGLDISEDVWQNDHENLIQLILQNRPLADFPQATYDSVSGTIDLQTSTRWQSTYGYSTLALRLEAHYHSQLVAAGHNPLNGYINSSKTVPSPPSPASPAVSTSPASPTALSPPTSPTASP